MGIRKHFENQEPKDQDLNLRDLSFETETTADPIRELEELVASNADAIKRSVYEMVERFKKEAAIPEDDFLELVLVLSVLSDTLEGFAKELGQDNEIFELLKQQYENGDTDQNGSLIALAIKSIFPDQFSAMQIDFEEFNRSYQNERRTEMGWLNGLNFSYCLAILFPDKIDELKIDQDFIQQCKHGLEKADDFATKSLIVSRAKVLFPKNLDEFNIVPKQIKEFAKQAQEPFEILQETKKPSEFDEILMATFFLSIIRILIAEKVEITEQGLKLTIPKAVLKTEKTKRPERRNF